MQRRSTKKQSAGKRSNPAKNDIVHNPPSMMEGPNMVLGFPHRLLTKLRYVDTIALATTTGSLAKQVFRWNSTFDPDVTGTGHQPLYRDTFAGIYDTYSVVSADVIVKFVNASTSIFNVGLTPEDDTTSSSTANTLAEQANAQATILPPVTGSLSSKTFRLHWDCRKNLNIDPFTSEAYKTAVGSNPAEESDFVCWAQDFDASSSAVTVHVELIQTVLWSELTSPTQS